MTDSTSPKFNGAMAYVLANVQGAHELWQQAYRPLSGGMLGGAVFRHEQNRPRIQGRIKSVAATYRGALEIEFSDGTVETITIRQLDPWVTKFCDKFAGLPHPAVSEALFRAFRDTMVARYRERNNPPRGLPVTNEILRGSSAAGGSMAAICG